MLLESCASVAYQPRCAVSNLNGTLLPPSPADSEKRFSLFFNWTRRESVLVSSSKYSLIHSDMQEFIYFQLEAVQS
jgi:hypothetical protein